MAPINERRASDPFIKFVFVLVGAAFGLFVLLIRNPIEAYIVSVEPPFPGINPTLYVDLFDAWRYEHSAATRDQLLVQLFFWRAAAICITIGAGGFCGWLVGRLMKRRIRKVIP
jgi:hypothetical protein